MSRVTQKLSQTFHIKSLREGHRKEAKGKVGKVGSVPHCLCFICTFHIASDAKFESISPCFSSVKTCKFYLADGIARVKPGLPRNSPLKGPLGPSVSVLQFLVIPLFHLFLSGGLSMSFAIDAAFHHPSVGIMSCVFAYTKHEEFFMVPHQPH